MYNQCNQHSVFGKEFEIDDEGFVLVSTLYPDYDAWLMSDDFRRIRLHFDDKLIHVESTELWIDEKIVLDYVRYHDIAKYYSLVKEYLKNSSDHDWFSWVR